MSTPLRYKAYKTWHGPRVVDKERAKPVTERVEQLRSSMLAAEIEQAVRKGAPMQPIKGAKP